MRTIATVWTMFAVVLGAFAFAQSPSFAEVCETQDIPTRAEYEGNATAYADNFCALATYAPQRAARQLNSMIALVRSHNNPNRFYWDPRIESDTEYIQLLRPWMAEQGWWIEWAKVQGGDTYSRHAVAHYSTHPPHVLYFTADQRELPTHERTPVFSLFMGINYIPDRDYRRHLRYFADMIGGYVKAEQLGDTNQYRVSIGRGDYDLGRRLYPSVAMTADVLSAAVTFALDCLSDIEEITGYDVEQEIRANCDGVVEVGTP